MNETTTSSFDELIGLTFKEIKGNVSDNEIILISSEGRKFQFYHEQDYCEWVSIEDIPRTARTCGFPRCSVLVCGAYSKPNRLFRASRAWYIIGDLNDLINSPMLVAEKNNFKEW